MDEKQLFESLRTSPKLVDELDDNERSAVLANKDSWTDEEKWAYQPLLVQNVEEEAEPTTEEEPIAEEAGAGQEPAESKEEPTAAETPASTEPLTFKSKEELQSTIEQVIAEREAAKPKEDQQTKAEQKVEAAKELIRFFPDGYVPKDANEFTNALLEKLAPLMVGQVKQAEEVEVKQRQDLNKKWDDEYNSLAAAGKVPALDTPEGKEVNAQIAALSAPLGISSYIAGYDIWARTAKEFGGGYEAKQEVKKQQMSEQKKAASMVSKGGTATPPAPQKADFNRIHNKSMDELIQEELG